MKPVRMIVATAVLLTASGLASAGYSQEAAQPNKAGQPQGNIDFTLTEALSRITTDAAKREDLREVPPPRIDKLSDAVHVTLIPGDPRCLPGEDGWAGPDRSRSRAPRPGRSR